MEPISKTYRNKIVEMMQFSKNQEAVTSENVYQPSNEQILPYINSMVGEQLLPGSELKHFEYFKELLAKAKAGESCMILAEHYSNFDLPSLHYFLIQQGPEGEELSRNIVAIAGMKLNEENPVVSAFSEAYSRIVIYPSRSLLSIKDPKEMVMEIYRSRSINRAAMKALDDLKKQGRIILVFPAGTRYRPWDPSTKKGVKEIDTYIKSFDNMILLSINGNILRINPDQEMSEDLVEKDVLILNPSPVIRCKEYRNQIKEATKFREDKKQAVVDHLMADLEGLHEDMEQNRRKVLGGDSKQA
jgi:hypothetical protein